ncbi:uncharacterized protein LOC131861109 [Cryptomeria japonica]|uniref:uncharacterized protein LOC131861109 n=1 Tax=Cryptomeria japonica TaxID=3369 RepID=UPI0027DA6076|nr:uncharacterized protein LOC131861109 [Cryptomeria japonica]
MKKHKVAQANREADQEMKTGKPDEAFDDEGEPATEQVDPIDVDTLDGEDATPDTEKEKQDKEEAEKQKLDKEKTLVQKTESYKELAEVRKQQSEELDNSPRRSLDDVSDVLYWKYQAEKAAKQLSNIQQKMDKMTLVQKTESYKELAEVRKQQSEELDNSPRRSLDDVSDVLYWKYQAEKAAKQC